jgi:AcrR family transcriptional regulator
MVETLAARVRPRGPSRDPPAAGGATIAGRPGASALRRYPRGVVIAEPAAADEAGLAPPSPAKARIVSAAAGLFAEYGVGGTSLQMIASAIGVTKAAVYHQFKTKEEIVIAAAEAELARLVAVMDAAEAEPTPELAREALLLQIVGLAVERRRLESTLVGDPVLVRFFAHYKPFLRVMGRLYRLLTGDDSGTEGRTRAAMLIAAIGGAVMHPLVADLDDDTLRTQLLQLARRFLDLPS